MILKFLLEQVQYPLIEPCLLELFPLETDNILNKKYEDIFYNLKNLNIILSNIEITPSSNHTQACYLLKGEPLGN